MKYYTRFEHLSYDCIVLANGAFPTAPIPLSLLERWAQDPERMFVACCDGAVNSLQTYTSLLPNIVVGDLDSVDNELRQRLSDRIVHIAEQETNDLTKTMHYVSQQLGYKRIVILGATGKRDDHTLGNLAWIPHYASWVEDLVVLTDTGYFRLICSDCSMEVGIGTQISIFNFSQTPLSLQGTHWPLADYCLPTLWSGTLNRADEETISIRTESPILIFIADKP